MRLWHTDLIPVLPRMQMSGQWREINSIYKKQDNHLLINFIYDKPKEDLYNYSVKLINELRNRNYKIDLTKFYSYFNGEKIDYMKKPFPEKMDDEYLVICYFNLLEKYRCGGITDEEWNLIEQACKEKVYNWVINNMRKEED